MADYQLMRCHGLTRQDWESLYEAQGGVCYLCDRPMTREDARIDHDHAICPQPRVHSCQRCRRGMAHDVCNKLIGLAEDSPDLLRLVAGNLEARKFSPSPATAIAQPGN
jgi:hypothetical protein